MSHICWHLWIKAESPDFKSMLWCADAKCLQCLHLNIHERDCRWIFFFTYTCRQCNAQSVWDTFEAAVSTNEVEADFTPVSIRFWFGWSNQTGGGARVAAGGLLLWRLCNGYCRGHTFSDDWVLLSSYHKMSLGNIFMSYRGPQLPVLPVRWLVYFCRSCAGSPDCILGNASLHLC